MTNPNNAIGTNGAFSGRTSPNALNDITAGYTKGIIKGWACSPKSGMTIQIGGAANTRDVALAEDNAGNKLTINNRSAAPIDITLSGAPATNNRVDAIVAYIDNPSTGDGSTTDNPTTCGIIPVSGTVAANPTAPTDAQIRTAITNDGATGGSAYYVVLATILVGTGVTTIGAGVITQGQAATSTVLSPLPDGSVTTSKIAGGAVTDGKIDWSSMASYSNITSTNVSLAANTEKVINTITVANPGTYLLIASARTGNSDNLTAFKIRQGTTVSGTVLQSQTGHGSYLQYAAVFAIVTIQSQTSFCLTARPNSATETREENALIAIRIG